MLRASDIMTTDVVTISSAATVAEAADLMKEKGWRSLIVDRDDEQDAYGIITETDITYKVTAVHKNPQDVQVNEIMTKPCIIVDPDLSLENVAALFANHRLLRAPVIQGQLLGIISISDILVRSNVLEQLREISPDPALPELVEKAQMLHSEETIPVEQKAVTWDAIEEKVVQLSQQQAETIINRILRDYYKDFDDLKDPTTLDNLCSG